MSNYIKPLHSNQRNNFPKTVCLEDASCPMGCRPDDQVLFSGHDRIYHMPGQFDVVKCRACGLMRTHPRPSPDTIGYYYPDSYGPYQGTRISDRLPVTQSRMKTLLCTLKRVLPTYIQHIPNLPPGRLLEIGCASGGFLQQMRSRGWQTTGIELSSSAAAAARAHGHTVFTGSVDSAPDPQNTYDLIVGWMVLEHLHDPVAALRRLYDWAAPGAWLVISVPNAGSLEFRLFTHRWYALHLPNHLFHFTPATLDRVLKHCGWQPKRRFHQRNLGNLMASCGFWLQDRQKLERLARWLCAFPEASLRVQAAVYPLAWILSVMGQTGRMTVWAQKQE